MKSKIDRREFIKLIAAGSAATMAGNVLSGCRASEKLSTCGGSGSTDKPNVVVIMTDDQGYADIGCYGAQGYETPHLDRMAAEGIRFTDFYVAAPFCSPTRASVLTGCYPQRAGMPDVAFPDWEHGFNSKEWTIAEALKTQGYTTGCFGKWHLGHHRQFLPTHHGFDEYFGLPYSNDMISSIPEHKHFNFPDHLPIVEGDEVVGYDPDQNQLTTMYTERAVKFIRQNKDKPFFLYLPHTMPHTPIYVSDKFKGKSEKGIYGDLMMEIDWSVGQILSTLKELRIDQNTIVMFLSDNGPWLKYGEHGGSAGPLREGKVTTFEGGQRVPYIVRWPGKIKAGSVCREMATSMDILPTVAHLTGAKLSANKIDGKNIWPLLSSKPGAKSPYEAFFYYFGVELQAVRSGKWKLHFPHKYVSFDKPGSDGLPGEEVMKDIGLSLYDLENDIGEQNNLVDQYPQVVKRLSALADKMRECLGDSLRGMEGKCKRPPGHI